MNRAMVRWHDKLGFHHAERREISGQRRQAGEQQDRPIPPPVIGSEQQSIVQFRSRLTK
jgi:hypothetical protein